MFPASRTAPEQAVVHTALDRRPKIPRLELDKPVRVERVEPKDADEDLRIRIYGRRNLSKVKDSLDSARLSNADGFSYRKRETPRARAKNDLAAANRTATETTIAKSTVIHDFARSGNLPPETPSKEQKSVTPRTSSNNTPKKLPLIAKTSTNTARKPGGSQERTQTTGDDNKKREYLRRKETYTTTTLPPIPLKQVSRDQTAANEATKSSDRTPRLPPVPAAVAVKVASKPTRDLSVVSEESRPPSILKTSESKAKWKHSEEKRDTQRDTQRTQAPSVQFNDRPDA